MSNFKRVTGSIVASGLLGAAAAIGLAAATAPDASAAPMPKIYDIYADRAATKASKGGFDVPYTESSYGWGNDGPRVTSTVYTTKNRFVTKKTNPTGSLPGRGEIRLMPGTYKVRTEAVEGDRKAVRWQTITIKVKTDRATLSRGEYKRIKKGMTKAKVRKIAGSKLKLNNDWLIERTDYRGYALIEWTKGGRVKYKVWSPGHD
jgi:hypothetical protein